MSPSTVPSSSPGPQLWSVPPEESAPSWEAWSLAGLMIAQKRRIWCQSLQGLLLPGLDSTYLCLLVIIAASVAPSGAQVGTTQLRCSSGLWDFLAGVR